MKKIILILLLFFKNDIELYSQTSITDFIDSLAIKEVFITMPDGVKLAADMYLPFPLPAEKLPIILEYLPYRKDEGRKSRYPLFSYFVKKKYIVARVDIRGTGRSEGHLVPYEYSEQELQDGEYIINWLSKLPYCNGNIAMFGISWGGFNGLHLAQRNPPALKTIITLMSTDDLYQDDVHYIDGIMHIDAYEIGQDLNNILPAAPDFEINNSYFKNRFDTEPWLLQYKRQQRDGEFWNRTATKNFYNQLNIPVFAIGGLFDGYRDFVLRLLLAKPKTTKAILGPYNHSFPHNAEPPPLYEWRYDAVRWLDYWLKNVSNSILQEPRLDLFIQTWRPPSTKPDSIPGFWVNYHTFPFEQSANLDFNLTNNHGLILENSETIINELSSSKIDTHYLKYIPSEGIEASGSVMWWGDWAPDQQIADKKCLIYEMKVEEDSIILAGFPMLKLTVNSTAPQANWIARLSDLAPDGTVIEITGSGFNGTHRYSTSAPTYLAADSFYTINFELHFATWVFRKGHKIRLAINNAQWPMFWATPYCMTTALLVGGQQVSSLTLPILKNIHPSTKTYFLPNSDKLLPFYQSIQSETNSGFAEFSNKHYNPKTHITTIKATNSGKDTYPFGTVAYTENLVYKIKDLKPEAASLQSIYTITIVNTKGQKIKLVGDLIFSSDRQFFYYKYTRRIYKKLKRIRKKTWQEKIPRDFQ